MDCLTESGGNGPWHPCQNKDNTHRGEPQRRLGDQIFIKIGKLHIVWQYQFIFIIAAAFSLSLGCLSQCLLRGV